MRYLYSFAAIFVLVLSLFCLESTVQSKENKGGFNGPVSGAAAVNAAEAKNQPAGSRVVLTGNIISRLAGASNEYMFKDDTGEIQLEISPKLFRNLYLTPENKVRVSGKVDRDKDKSVEINVKVLEVLP